MCASKALPLNHPFFPLQQKTMLPVQASGLVGIIERNTFLREELGLNQLDFLWLEL